MTSFFPDLNVWLALSVGVHRHNAGAWRWLNSLPPGARLIFSRYTHIGLLRLLTNQAAMGEQTLTLRKAWRPRDRQQGLRILHREANPRLVVEVLGHPEAILARPTEARRVLRVDLHGKGFG